MGIPDRDYTKRDENGNLIGMSTQSKRPMNNYIGSSNPVLTQEEFDRMRGKKRNIFSYVTSKFHRLLKLNK